MGCCGKDEKADRNPGNSAFKQQKLKAWQPILTPKPVIMTFFVVALLFIPIGAIILGASSSVQEVVQLYSEAGDPDCVDTDCVKVFDVTIDEDMEGPVFFYYRLQNFYQNHRRYVQSRSDAQLRGEDVTVGDLGDCEPYITGDGDEEVLVPCGLIAKSMFTDRFTLRNKDGSNVSWTGEGIAWSSDKEGKFKNPDPEKFPTDSVNRVIEDFTDEEFIVWMRTAGLPDFKKLHRIIEGGLKKGTYEVQIEDTYPVADFNGKKYFVFSTTSWIGGKNPFLGWAYLVVGALSLLQGIVFFLRQQISPRKSGDPSYLDFSK